MRQNGSAKRREGGAQVTMRASRRRRRAAEGVDAGALLRFQPAFKFGIEVVGASWVLTSFLSWVLLNAYLKAIGQRGVPLDLAGTWVVLLLMGAVLTLSLAVIGSVFAAAEEMMRFLHRGKPIEFATRCTFAVAVWISLGGLFALEDAFGWSLQAAVIALPVGFGVGIALGAKRWFRDHGGERDGPRFAGVLAFWIIVTVPLLLLVTAEFSIVLRMQFSEIASFRLALLLSIAQLTLCTMLPRRWAIGATVAGTAWLATTVSPGMYAIVLVALEATNQGGGLPSGALTTKEAATICNLGTPQRPVIYRELEGCTKKAALEKLKAVVSADTAMKKAEIIVSWGQTGNGR